MVTLRDEARGRACQIRVPMECLPGNDTVVGCHVRMIGVSGAGQKSPDAFIAWGCQRCHDICDGRAKSNYSAQERRLMLLEGMMRTQYILIREGKL